jgi:hypothetical protein
MCHQLIFISLLKFLIYSAYSILWKIWTFYKKPWSKKPTNHEILLGTNEKSEWTVYLYVVTRLLHPLARMAQWLPVAQIKGDKDCCNGETALLEHLQLLHTICTILLPLSTNSCILSLHSYVSSQNQFSKSRRQDHSFAKDIRHQKTIEWQLIEANKWQRMFLILFM